MRYKERVGEQLASTAMQLENVKKAIGKGSMTVDQVMAKIQSIIELVENSQNLVSLESEGLN